MTSLLLWFGAWLGVAGLSAQFIYVQLERQPGSLSLLRLGVSFKPMLVVRIHLLKAIGVSLLTS